MVRGHHLSFCAVAMIILGLCSSCCLSDPRYAESTPCAPCTRWQPPCQPKIDTLCTFSEQEGALNACQLIDIALKNNPETRVTWARAKAAAYQLQASKSTWYPTVDAEVNYALTYQNFGGSDEGGIVFAPTIDVDDDDFIDPTELPSTPALAEFTNSGKNQLIFSDIAARYLLLDFGEREGTIESARQALKMANWMHNRNIQHVMFNVLTTYYEFLNAKAQLDAQYDDLEDAEVNVEAAKELYEAGVKTKLDLLQAQSQLVNIQLVIEDTTGQVKTALGRLANALGVPANAPIHAAELPEDLVVEDRVDSVENLMEAAKTCRPDLAAACAEFRKKQADLQVAYSQGMPTMTANADFERVDALDSHSSTGYVYSTSIGIQMPLYHGCLFSNKRRAARSRVKEAYASMQDKESDVLLEVWESYYAFKTAVQTYNYSLEFLKYTEETYEAALNGYKEGTGTILDLLSAQKALARARASKIQARTQWVTSLAGIAYATGTL